MTKETAKERRAREAAEYATREEQWEKDKPMKLLETMARAIDLDVSARLVAIRYMYINGGFAISSVSV